MRLGKTKIIYPSGKEITRDCVELDDDGVTIVQIVGYPRVPLRDLDHEVGWESLFMSDPFEWSRIKWGLEILELDEIQEESGMPEVDINLDEVKEKPALHLLGMGPYTFSIVKSELTQSKEPNKRTGVKEWNVALETVPAEQPDYKIRHWFSLAPGALESADPLFSIKKFFSTVGFQWRSDGKFNSDDLMLIRFIGTVAPGKKNPNFTELATVIKGA